MTTPDGRQHQLPLPDPNTEPDSEEFWRSAHSGRLVITRCTECGDFVWIPRPFCPRHMTATTEWVEVSGRGTIYSYTVVHRGDGAYAGSPPFVLAYVELVEGPRVMTNIIDASTGELSIGASVKVVFDSVDEQKAIPRFRVV